MDYTVKDSSLWVSSDVSSILGSRDTSIRMGVVQKTEYDKIIDETIYIVEVATVRGYIPVSCRKMERFGGAFNYEEFGRQVFSHGSNSSTNREFNACPGDLVLVAYINGMKAYGVILGGLRHPGRSERLPKNESGYISEFNGVEVKINKDGEWQQTFKGLPTNISALNSSTRSKLPEPKYDDAVGTGFTKWDKTGSYTISDNAKSKLQSIKIDKPNGKIIITSGSTVLTIDKNAESYVIKNKITDIESTKSFSLKTDKCNIEASSSYTLKSPKIDTDGKWKQNGDVSISGKTDIVGNTSIMGNLSQTGNFDLTGNLKTTGQVSLAGGASAMLTDIILIMGTGNLGAPVISSATVLKTVLTKAT